MDQINDMIERAFIGNWIQAIEDFKAGVCDGYTHDHLLQVLSPNDYYIFCEICFMVANELKAKI